MRLIRFNRLRGLNRLCLCLTAALLCGNLLFLRCSRSDVITGAGGSVVGDSGDSLTNLGRGFATIVLDAKAVDSAYSLPSAPDPLFGTRSSADILVGVSEDGDTLAAYMQFTIAGDTAYANLDTLKEAYIYFRLADGQEGVTPDGGITLSACNPLPGALSPVDKNDKQPVNSGDSGSAGNNGELLFSGGGLDSIKLSDSIAAKIYTAKRASPDSAAGIVAFSILDYTGQLLKIHSPYIILTAGQKNCCPESVNWKPDTLTDPAVRYTAFESGAAAADRAKAPYSSQRTNRTAVFKVDIGRALDSLNNKNGWSVNNVELLNALVIVQYKPEPGLAKAAADGDTALALSSKNVGNYKALILDTLITQDISLDGAADSADLLRGRFNSAASTAPNTVTHCNSHSFKQTMRKIMEKYIAGDNDLYMYVYLRPVAEGSVILWDKPPKIETVFTPSRK